jgi:hypothetical protein
MMPNAMFQRLYGCDKSALEKTPSGGFRIIQGPVIRIPGRQTIIGNRSLTFTPAVPPHLSKRPCIRRLPAKLCRFDTRHSPTTTRRAACVDQHAHKPYKNDKSCCSKPVKSHVTSFASCLGIQQATLRRFFKENAFRRTQLRAFRASFGIPSCSPEQQVFTPAKSCASLFGHGSCCARQLIPDLASGLD